MILPPAFPPPPRRLAVTTPCPVSTACPHSAQRRHGSREMQQAATGLSQLLSRTPRAPTLAAASQNQGCHASVPGLRPQRLPRPGSESQSHFLLSSRLPGLQKGCGQHRPSSALAQKGRLGDLDFSGSEGRAHPWQSTTAPCFLPASRAFPHCPPTSRPGATGCGCALPAAPCASSPHWPDPQPLASGSSTPSFRLSDATRTPTTCAQGQLCNVASCSTLHPISSRRTNRGSTKQPIA